MGLARCSVPVPSANFACSLGEFEALLAESQGLLGPLALSDIETDPTHARGFTVVAEQHHAFCEHPAHASVRAEQTKFSFPVAHPLDTDRKSTRLNSSHLGISYA